MPKVRATPDLVLVLTPGWSMPAPATSNCWRTIRLAASAAAAGYCRVDQLGMVNVAVQLAKLESHPVAGPALADGRVQATGLFYDIATARVVLVRQAGIEFLDPEQAAEMSTAHAPAG